MSYTKDLSVIAIIFMLLTIVVNAYANKKASTAVDAPASALLPEDKFTKIIVDRFHERYPDKKVNISNADHLVIKVLDANSQSPWTLQLANGYQLYKSNPDDLNVIIDRYVNNFAAGEKENIRKLGEIDVKHIVPVILNAVNKKSPIKYYYQTLNEELIVGYVVDNENTMRYILTDNFSALNLSDEKLKNTSVINLRRSYPHVKIEGSKELYVVSINGDYDASLILYDDLWNHQNFKVKGDIVVAIPAKDALIVTGSENPASIHKMKKAVKSIYQSNPYHITDKLFVRRNHHWVVFN